MWTFRSLCAYVVKPDSETELQAHPKIAFKNVLGDVSFLNGHMVKEISSDPPSLDGNMLGLCKYSKFGILS